MPPTTPAQACDAIDDVVEQLAELYELLMLLEGNRRNGKGRKRQRKRRGPELGSGRGREAACLRKREHAPPTFHERARFIESGEGPGTDGKMSSLFTPHGVNNAFAMEHLWW